MTTSAPSRTTSQTIVAVSDGTSGGTVTLDEVQEAIANSDGSSFVPREADGRPGERALTNALRRRRRGPLDLAVEMDVEGVVEDRAALGAASLSEHVDAQMELIRGKLMAQLGDERPEGQPVDVSSN